MSIQDNITETEIIQTLLNNINTHVYTSLFAYFPMRLSGTGITERMREGKAYLINRDLARFSTQEFMSVYACIPICVEHPTNEKGEFVPLGFSHAHTIIGNAIHSFLRDNEIWIIARIHNKDMADLILSNEFSTSPYFISQEEEHVLENGDTIAEEIPLLCNHVAIVANGYWDKKTLNKPISKEYNMQEDTKIDNAEIKADNTEEIKADTQETEVKADEVEEVKADNTEEETKADTQAELEETKADEIPSVSALIDEINTLKAQVDSLMQASDMRQSEADLQEKDSVIEAINEIADSHDVVERISVRVGDNAKDILQKFLNTNKKHITKKYHALIDSMPQNAYLFAKTDILQDMKNNLAEKQKAQFEPTQQKGWVTLNGALLGYKF